MEKFMKKQDDEADPFSLSKYSSLPSSPFDFASLLGHVGKENEAPSSKRRSSSDSIIGKYIMEPPFHSSLFFLPFLPPSLDDHNLNSNFLQLM